MYKTYTAKVRSRRSDLEKMGEEQHRSVPVAAGKQVLLRPRGH
jgi:hypothetical protein